MNHISDDTRTPDFKSLFESMPMPYLVLLPDDPIFTIIAMSDNYPLKTKTKREEILGRSIFEVFPDNPDDSKATGVKNLRASFMKVIHDHVTDEMALQRYDLPLPKLQGGGFEKRYWKPINSPVFDSERRLTYIIHHIEDVTKLEKLKQYEVSQSKRSYDELELAEAKYRELLESAQDAILMIGNSGTIAFVNDQTLNWFGYSREELLGQPIEILLPERFRTVHIHQKDVYLAQPTKRPMGRPGLELKGRRKDGSEFSVDIALSPSGKPEEKLVTAIIRDVTERQDRESRVRFIAQCGKILGQSLEQEDTLKKIGDLIVSEIADGCRLILCDENGEFQTVVISHRDPEMLRSLESLFSSFLARGFLPPDLSTAMQTQEIQIHRDFQKMVTLDAHIVPLERQELDRLGKFASVLIPFTSKGRTIGFARFIWNNPNWQLGKFDIQFWETVVNRIALSIENARLYEVSQRSIKVREEILSIVSHDLKNPLTTISLLSQLLLKIKENDFSKLSSYSDKIKRSADQMQRMIEDLMDFSKIQEGNLSVEKQLEKPISLIELVYEMMKGSADEKGLKFSSDVSSDLSELPFDKQRMAQALMNLVGNAIKFTNKGGQVNISVKEFPESMKFSITDSGPGIHSDDLSRVFDRYWQAQKSKTLSAGLGLSITKGIAEAHGGTVLIESQLGKGSTFIISLPK